AARVYLSHLSWGEGAPYRGVTTTPSGTIPVVAYRHRAMRILRATATIPIRRTRFPPPAKRRANHCVIGLAGCHRIHCHASCTLTACRRLLPARLTPCSCDRSPL